MKNYTQDNIYVRKDGFIFTLLPNEEIEFMKNYDVSVDSNFTNFTTIETNSLVYFTENGVFYPPQPYEFFLDGLILGFVFVTAAVVLRICNKFLRSSIIIS